MKILKKPKIMPNHCNTCGALIQLEWRDLRPWKSEGKSRVKEVATCPLCKGLVVAVFALENDSSDEKGK